MAKNDVVLLDALIDQRIHAATGSDRSELFEYFVFEQVLKSFDLDRDDLISGWTDGRHDGGIDGFYTFVNGHLVSDTTTFVWPRSKADIDVFLITCKHHDTFQQATLDALLASFQEIFDLSKEPRQFSGKYSDNLLKARAKFVVTYKQLSLLRPNLVFKVIYASRGDTSVMGESVAARGEQIRSLLESDFSASKATFVPLGATELVEAYRQVKSFSLSLPFLEHLTAAEDGYVLLARLADYSRFVSDDKGNLRRYLFDSNVRDFLGENAVNSDITETLADSTAPNFWWLNNGVTVLATRATVVGKTIQLQDIQIVNGLQTTETLHRFFQSEPISHLENRSLLIKVIVSADESVRDQVIRATNNQSTVESSALHATDKIQRDIEEILEGRSWFYERRKNYFRNAGKPAERIVTPLQMATGAVALLFKNPERASSLKQKHLRRQVTYEAIFSDQFPIRVWPAIADCMRLADDTLLRYQGVHRTARPRYLSKWSGLLAYLSLTAYFKNHFFSPADLASIEGPNKLEDLMLKCAEELSKAVGTRGFQVVSRLIAERACAQVSSHFGVQGIYQQARKDVPSTDPEVIPSRRSTTRTVLARKKVLDVPQGLLDAVDSLLPSQPWKPGVHTAVAKELGIESKEVSLAIRKLIACGRRHDQRDGVVYDQHGKVIATDPTRIKPLG